MGNRCEEGQLASGDNARPGDGESGLHIVDSTEDDGVELTVGGHRFDASGPDFGGEVEGTDGFAEEGGLFVLGFGERDLDLRTEEGDGDSGETCSRAEVEEGGGVGVEMTGGEEAFAEVAADDLLRIADGGEVSAGVPLEEEIEVEGELSVEVGRRGV